MRIIINVLNKLKSKKSYLWSVDENHEKVIELETNVFQQLSTNSYWIQSNEDLTQIVSTHQTIS
jgi:hypothetical protein